MLLPPNVVSKSAYPSCSETKANLNRGFMNEKKFATRISPCIFAAPTAIQALEN